MRELTRNTRETSQLGILFEDSLSFLEIIEGLSTTTRAEISLKLPLHAPAAGKVLFAYQPEEVIAHILKELIFPALLKTLLWSPAKS